MKPRRPDSRPVCCAAVDLGATSGRVIVGAWADGRLELAEVHRFANAFGTVAGRDYWDIAGLWREIARGLGEARRRFPSLASAGVDCWGVDHALVDRRGRLVYPVHAYRDSRTEPWRARLARRGLPRIYGLTGIPNLFYNTSLQLQAALRSHPGLTGVADRCLFLPDYFNFLLCGRMETGLSIASTSQLLSVDRPAFSREALDFFGIPARWFSKPAPSGLRLGTVRELADLGGVEVIAVPGHDTACAYEAMPADEAGGDLYVSLGTWALTGFESDKPVLGREALAAGVSNERMGDGRFRPLASSAGLWLLERLLADFGERPENAGEWEALIAGAASSARPSALVDPAHPSLANPSSMRESLDRLVRASGGRPPSDLHGYARLVFDSLAAGQAAVLGRFERLSGRRFSRILVTGGGSRNRYLCQAMADAAGVSVRVCSGEGSATGNLASQLVALGAVGSLREFRRRILATEPPVVYRPSNKGGP